MAAAAKIGDSSIPKTDTARPPQSAHRQSCKRRQKQVLPDIAHGRQRQSARLDNAHQVAAQQGNAGAFDGHIGAGAHGHTHIRRCQGRRIVNAIAGHDHNATFVLQALNNLALVFRQDFRFHFVNMQFAGYRFG